MEEEIQEIPVTITNDLERRIADAFLIYDHSANSTMDVRELGTVVRGLGCCPSEAELQELILEVEDQKVPGIVHLAHFMPYMVCVFTEHKFEPATAGGLLDAFRVLDKEGIGYLTKEQLTKLMTEYGEPFTQDELDGMLEGCLDPYNDTIQYEYFINKLIHCPPPEINNYATADYLESLKPPPPPPQKRVRSSMEF